MSNTSKIIIVGNGENILDKKNGHLIDNFDKVVRLGQYKTKGYEEFTGTKTDILSTIFWKLDFERLKNHKIILNVPLNMQEQFFESEKFVEEKYSNYKSNILYMNKFDDIEGLREYYKKTLPAFTGIDDINFSLGFKTFYFIEKLFPDSTIYATGFDFFKTGWYWDKTHNRDNSNMHPYTQERLWYLKKRKDGEIYEL